MTTLKGHKHWPKFHTKSANCKMTITKVIPIDKPVYLSDSIHSLSSGLRPRKGKYESHEIQNEKLKNIRVIV